jgi:hypothetical protein
MVRGRPRCRQHAFPRGRPGPARARVDRGQREIPARQLQLYPPLITVEAWNAPATTVPGLPAAEVRPTWAGNLADLLAVLGHDDIAGLVRQAAALTGEPRR